MGTTPNYTWPLPDPTDPPNVPQHLGDLGKAQDGTLKSIENRVTNEISSLDARISRAEYVCRGNLKRSDFAPDRIINSTTMSELAALAHTLTIPPVIPAHATHYIIEILLYVTTYNHGDFRLGAKLNGQELSYFDFRPVGAPVDAGALVSMTYDVELAGRAAGDYPLTFWARNGISGVESRVRSGRAWAYLV
ncbi:hypothetical protein [Actinomadura litoris]|uniref:hypothetical protein n=1 Tax=Actinomadura litoris TaxID=2678616 RepID=UPI001FA77F9C|nr:hypothetical protein [Actinomadura litoris]